MSALGVAMLYSKPLNFSSYNLFLSRMNLQVGEVQLILAGPGGVELGLAPGCRSGLGLLCGPQSMLFCRAVT